MAITASAVLMRYSMSLGVRSVVPGIGNAPSFIRPSMTTYHSCIRGSMTNTRSPFLIPRSLRVLAYLLESIFRSQKLWCSTLSPLGFTEIKASLVRSSAHLSTTSNPKLKNSGTSNRSFLMADS